MIQLKQTKINKLINHWPRGVVYASSWLHQQGYGYDLIRSYKKNNWVFTIGDNAIARVGDKVSWEGGLYALQKHLGLNIHVGGKTALEIIGQGHFIMMGRQRIFLYGTPGTVLPAWFKKYDWGADIQFVTTNLFPLKENVGLSSREIDLNFSVTASSSERALIELLHLVPQSQSFEEAALLMETQMTLRPKLVQELLESCRSIKVKRLFMHFAEEFNLPWIKRLDLSKVDFGKGNRVIVKGAPLDKKYKITAPKLRDIQGDSSTSKA